MFVRLSNPEDGVWKNVLRTAPHLQEVRTTCYTLTVFSGNGLSMVLSVSMTFTFSFPLTETAYCVFGCTARFVTQGLFHNHSILTVSSKSIFIVRYSVVYGHRWAQFCLHLSSLRSVWGAFILCMILFKDHRL